MIELELLSQRQGISKTYPSLLPMFKLFLSPEFDNSFITFSETIFFLCVLAPAEPGKFDLVYENPDGSERVEYAVTHGSQVFSVLNLILTILLIKILINVHSLTV